VIYVAIALMLICRSSGYIDNTGYGSNDMCDINVDVLI